MKVKRMKIATLAFALSFAFAFQAGAGVKLQALQAVCDEIAAELKGVKALDGKTVAVLPIAGDRSDTFADMLRIAVTKAGKNCVTGKEDPLFDEIVKEITWDARKSDILDEATVSRFGKLKSAQTILTGRVLLSGDERCVFVECELHATEIETKRHVWGDQFVKRIYQPGVKGVKGLSEIPVEVRKVLQEKLTAKLVQSINEQQKLKGFKTVAFLPLAGDIDAYVANIVRDAVVKTALTPKNLDIRTLAEARLILRDKKLEADGLLYGALRDISFDTYTEGRKSGMTVNVEIQACIEKAGSNEQVWSDTLLVSESSESDLAGLEGLLADYPFLPMAALAVLGALFLLIVLKKILGAATRVR
jgi:hypothetical protein